MNLKRLEELEKLAQRPHAINRGKLTAAIPEMLIGIRHYNEKFIGMWNAATKAEVERINLEKVVKKIERKAKQWKKGSVQPDVDWLLEVLKEGTKK